jgi:hypothetical protein
MSNEALLTFLFVSHHPNMTSLGAMRATLQGLMAERKLSEESFRECFQKGMLRMDEHACLIWVPSFLESNTPESPNVIKGWTAIDDFLPECALKEQIYTCAASFAAGMGQGFLKALPVVIAKYLPCLKGTESLPEALAKGTESLPEALAKGTESLPEALAKGTESLPEALAKGMPNQEQEQEQDQEKDPASLGGADVLKARKILGSDEGVAKIHARLHKEIMRCHPKAKLPLEGTPAWAKEVLTVHRLFTVDGYSLEDVRACFTWLFCTEHDNAVFWRAQVQAITPLRNISKGMSKFGRIFEKWQAVAEKQAKPAARPGAEEARPFPKACAQGLEESGAAAIVGAV